MIHLRHSPLLLPYSSGYKQEILIIPYGFRVFEVKELKMKRRNGCFRAVEKDSEFEFDPDKAREALRKLDEQLLSLSKKQVDPPKIRVGARLKQSHKRDFTSWINPLGENPTRN